MAQYNNVYQRAFYYDIALRRDVSQEVDFILAVYQQYNGAELQSILDIACGPAYHARAFARRGLEAVGLDLQPEMVDYAHDQALADGVEVTWLAADMRRFQLMSPVAMAICMFDGMDSLLLNEDIVAHFSTVAANLSANGLYLLEHTHPRDSGLQQYGDFRYGGEREGTTVDIVWATNEPAYHPVTGVAQVEIEMRIQEKAHEQIIHDSAQERFVSVQEINLLAELSGALEVVGSYGDFDLAQPLDNSPASRRMITVLQKVR